MPMGLNGPASGCHNVVAAWLAGLEKLFFREVSETLIVYSLLTVGRTRNHSSSPVQCQPASPPARQPARTSPAWRSSHQTLARVVGRTHVASSDPQDQSAKRPSHAANAGREGGGRVGREEHRKPSPRRLAPPRPSTILERWRSLKRTGKNT